MASTTVNFNLKTAGYVNYANQTLTFRLLTLGAEAATGDQSYVTLPGVVTATSAANGDGSVSLFRNGKSGIESVYEVILPNREKAKFIIPAGSTSIELATLLVDHVPSGSNVQQSSVYAEAIKRANHTGTQLLSTLSDASTVQLKPSEGAFVNGDKTKLDSIAGSTTEEIQDIAGALVATGGTKTGIAVTYDDANNNMDFVVASQTDQNFTTADHSKLDGIETSATADQTASEIRTLVESATDSNVFTDADHTKLNGIEAGSKAQVNFVPRSISFTNNSAFLSVTDDNNLDVGTGDFSFSFAARVSSSSNASVLQKNGSAGYAVFFNSGALKLTLNSSGTSDFELATGLNDNKWHTYVITVDRDDTAIAYVDGVAQTGVSVSGKAGNLDNTAAFQIGLVGSTPGSGIALGNYVSLHKEELGSTAANNIYFSPDTALGAGSTELMVDLRRADKTFTDLSTNGFTVATNGVIIFNEGRITSLDGVGDINCSSISADVATTGLNVIFDGTDTGDNKITLTDNLASALDITESTNSYLKFTTTNSGEKIVFGKDLDISGDHDLIIGTSTGTKIGTATTQKIGFFNATPVVQQSGVNETTGFTAGSGTAVNDVSTFTGNAGSTAYRVNDIVKALKNLGILAP